MDRIVVIDADRAHGQAILLACARDGVAVRLAETVGEGVRHLMDAPASAVLVDAGVIRLPVAEQARLFQSVAPGLAMVALGRGMGSEERLRFEVEGFQVLDKSVDVREMLAKIEPRAVGGRRARGARPVRGV